MTEPYYSDEQVTLYLGDMREVPPALNLQADPIVADPPYEETSHQWDRWPDGWPDGWPTLAAARQCGRRAIGIEAHEPYAEAAARRLSALVLT